MESGADQSSSESVWQKTQFANLVRYVPSGVYFARLRVGGKLIRKSLRTKSVTVAKLKLTDLEKEERRRLEACGRMTDGKAFFGDMLQEYRKRLHADHSTKPRTKEYREELIRAMLKTWPGLERKDVRKISEQECRSWATRHAQTSSASCFNNTIGTLRAIFAVAIEQGLRYSNPADQLKRAKIKPKELQLPSQEQFTALLAEIRKVPFGPGLASADLVEFLAYGGFRRGEAANVTWADVDFDRQEILVRGDPETGTKNGEIRRVPMIPDMKELLHRLRDKKPAAKPSDKVMRIRECQGAITRVCKQLGIVRFTHHDLRHLFATRCIESGVDIPTVSRWLGHKDGGALAMKVYGHLRDQHSTNMAQLVSFGGVRSDTSDTVVSNRRSC
jgi:integrase